MKRDIGFYAMIIGFGSFFSVLPIVAAIAPECAPTTFVLGLLLFFGGAIVAVAQQ